MQQHTFRFNDHKTLFIAVGVLLVVSVMVVSELLVKGILRDVYACLAALLVVSTFGLLLRPRAVLAVLLIYLASPAPTILTQLTSALISVILILNCFVATALAGPGIRISFRSLRLPVLLAGGMLGVVAYGILQGNSLRYVLGDFYQIAEFAAVFALTRIHARSEESWRFLVHVLVGSILITSILQLSDAALGADYLPKLEEFGVKFLRTINLSAPIAFGAIAALFPAAKAKAKGKLLLAAFSILTVNLVMGFTRGLWLATLVSLLFLLFLQPSSDRRKTLKFVFAGTAMLAAAFAVTSLLSANVLRTIEGRISFSFTQYQNASGDEETLSARRFIEYFLIGKQVLEHPVLGKGLGATYEIAGAAILGGPQGQQVDYHFIHNVYLLIAFRLGIPALLVFCFLLWKYFRIAIRNYRSSRLPREDLALMAGLIAAVFGEIALNITSPAFFNHPTGGILACVMALTVAVPKGTSNSESICFSAEN